MMHTVWNVCILSYTIVLFFVQCGPVHVLVKLLIYFEINRKRTWPWLLIWQDRDKNHHWYFFWFWLEEEVQVKCTALWETASHIVQLVFRCWVWVWCDLHRLSVSLERSISDGVASRAKLLITAWSSSQTLEFWSSLIENPPSVAVLFSAESLCVCVRRGRPDPLSVAQRRLWRCSFPQPGAHAVRFLRCTIDSHPAGLREEDQRSLSSVLTKSFSPNCLLSLSKSCVFCWTFEALQILLLKSLLFSPKMEL